MQTTVFLIAAKNFSVPSAPPANITARNTSSTSILIEWKNVPLTDSNGIITNYKVYVKESTSRAWGNPATVVQQSYEKRGLKYWTIYDFKISASTSMGEGGTSEPSQIKTDEDSRYLSAQS